MSVDLAFHGVEALHACIQHAVTDEILSRELGGQWSMMLLEDTLEIQE